MSVPENCPTYFSSWGENYFLEQLNSVEKGGKNENDKVTHSALK